ncbi:MAG: hydrolase 1, exosortase A system-associated [Methylococcaceae bacterium]|nr:hydrolase 1, exosortase A system-associated [Methylococcaceae bacterium]
MRYGEIPVVFECNGCRLVGIITQPAMPAMTGILIVVGGPQYRSGSHRQFTLLARQLADKNIPSLRFDYRGMGDSEGESRNFENIDDDLRSAVDVFLATHPSLSRVVIWGLCDAASAALYYAHTDPRVSGLVLLNPWVHSEVGAKRARMKYYYLARLMQRSFWSKLFSGKVKIGASMGDLAHSAQTLLPGIDADASTPPGNPLHGSAGYIDRMLDGFKRFPGKVLLILSGNDLTSREFQDLARSHKDWKAICVSPKVEKHILSEANHTFSSQTWRNQVGLWTLQWLQENWEC